MFSIASYPPPPLLLFTIGFIHVPIAVIHFIQVFGFNQYQFHFSLPPDPSDLSVYIKSSIEPPLDNKLEHGDQTQAKNFIRPIQPPRQIMNRGDSIKPNLQPRESTKPHLEPGESTKPNNLQPGESTKPNLEPGESTKLNLQPGESTKPHLEPGELTKPNLQPGLTPIMI